MKLLNPLICLLLVFTCMNAAAQVKEESFKSLDALKSGQIRNDKGVKKARIVQATADRVIMYSNHPKFVGGAIKLFDADFKLQKSVPFEEIGVPEGSKPRVEGSWANASTVYLIYSARNKSTSTRAYYYSSFNAADLSKKEDMVLLKELPSNAQAAFGFNGFKIGSSSDKKAVYMLMQSADSKKEITVHTMVFDENLKLTSEASVSTNIPNRKFYFVDHHYTKAGELLFMYADRKYGKVVEEILHSSGDEQNLYVSKFAGGEITEVKIEGAQYLFKDLNFAESANKVLCIGFFQKSKGAKDEKGGYCKMVLEGDKLVQKQKKNFSFHSTTFTDQFRNNGRDDKAIQKALERAGEDIEVSQIVSAADGGFWLVGESCSVERVVPGDMYNMYFRNILVMKFDADGNVKSTELIWKTQHLRLPAKEGPVKVGGQQKPEQSVVDFFNPDALDLHIASVFAVEKDGKLLVMYNDYSSSFDDDMNFKPSWEWVAGERSTNLIVYTVDATGVVKTDITYSHSSDRLYSQPRFAVKISDDEILMPQLTISFKNIGYVRLRLK